MSVNLILTSYSERDKRKLMESDSKNLEAVELSGDFFKEYVDSHVADIDVWDTEEGPPYQQKAVKDQEIRQIVDGCEESAENLMKAIAQGGSLRERDSCFDRITMILNVRRLLKKKITKYAEEDNIRVIVG